MRWPLTDVIKDIAARAGRPNEPITLEDVAREYPAMVTLGLHPKNATRPAAMVKVEYNPDNLRLMRSIRGAYFNKEQACWIVPFYSVIKLAETMWIIASRSKG